jgi:hypothetical protein
MATNQSTHRLLHHDHDYLTIALSLLLVISRDLCALVVNLGLWRMVDISSFWRDSIISPDIIFQQHHNRLLPVIRPGAINLSHVQLLSRGTNLLLRPGQQSRGNSWFRRFESIVPLCFVSVDHGGASVLFWSWCSFALHVTFPAHQHRDLLFLHHCCRKLTACCWTVRQHLNDPSCRVRRDAEHHVDDRDDNNNSRWRLLLPTHVRALPCGARWQSWEDGRR